MLKVRRKRKKILEERIFFKKFQKDTVVTGLNLTMRTTQTATIFLKIALLIMFSFYFDMRSILKILKCATQNKAYF